MSATPHPASDSLPILLAVEVDQIADRFEADWLAGRSPRLEEFLVGAAETVRTPLLRELVRIEIEYRRQRGTAPTLQEYQARFPDQTALLAEVWGNAPPIASPAQGQPKAATALHVDEPREVDDEDVAGAIAIPGYEIVGLLGKGGMGIVYKARQVELNRIVALKMIRAQRVPDAASRARFRAEAQIVAQFDHPNIVRVHDSGEHAGRPYYALEYVPGGTLLETRIGQPWSAEAAAELLAQLADAVAYAHRQGIVHRDLKPANILLTAKGLPKITDFGLSKQLQADAGGYTRPGEPIGTPAYMAPEQADGRLDVMGPSTDIFGLGAILYYLLTSQPLFQGDRLEEILAQARHGQVPSPRQLNPSVPAALDRICLKALAAEPQKRYASAAAFAADLRRFLRRRRRLLLVASTAAALLLVASGIWGMMRDGNSTHYPAASTTMPGLAQDAAVARRAQEVLATYCHRCHGQDGNVEGGFNYVLDRAQLVARKKIVPNHPDKSRLFKRLTESESPMPPVDETPRPSEADIAAVRRWIEAGAPEFGSGDPIRGFVSTDDMLHSIREDLERASPRDRPFRRYFTLTHLYNAGLPPDGLKTYRHGLSKLVNSLSWGKRIIPPQPIGPTDTVFRIDLRDYRWDENTWERIVTANPYAVPVDSEDARYITGATGCTVPSCRADWFVFAASRPPLYHQVLQMPQTATALEELLRVKVAQNIRQERVARAGFSDSGISKNNRMIERHESDHGAYWKSYDFTSNLGRQSLFEHPLGPGPGANTFRHDGSEIIFNLPNDLQAYLLVDANGQRIDKAPINIVSDPRQADRAVVNGISCMSCHTAGIIDKADQVRKTVENSSGAFTKGDAEVILALYKPRSEFSRLVKEDAERFAAAVRKTGAQLSTTDPVVALSQRYEWDADLKLVAAEVGVKPDVFLQAVGRTPQLTRTFGPLRVEGGTVQRQVIEAAFADLVKGLELGGVGDGPVSRPKPEPEIVNSVGMRFRRIPAGKFRMGSPAQERERGEDEQHHTVEITRPFALGILEVTQQEYEAVMGKKPSFFSATGKGSTAVTGLDTRRFPVETVSWEEAVEFCKRLSEREAERSSGRSYRLPTEAEWEYACRGGVEDAPTHFGASLSSSQANFDGNRPYGGAAKGVLLNRVAAVGSFEPNGFGLHDMHGNVAEWCADWWDRDYYPRSPAQDPAGPPTGTFHILRGGSWTSDGKDCRSADRRHSVANYRSNTYGFRVLLVLDKAP